MLGGAAEHSEVYPQLPVSVRGGGRGGGRQARGQVGNGGRGHLYSAACVV